jgi:hypothetical protein
VLLYHCDNLIRVLGFSSLEYLGKYCTFVCGTLFPARNLIELYCRKQSCTYKSMSDLKILNSKTQFPHLRYTYTSPMSITLGSRTYTNIGHNHTKI